MRFMQLSVNCLAPTAVWRTGGAPAYDGLPNGALTLLLANAPLRIVPTRGPSELFFVANQVIETIEDETVDRREYRVHTLGYIYTLAFDEGLTNPLVEWHYHPYAGRADTHVHVTDVEGSPTAKLHIPTGRTSFESIIRFIISDFRTEDPHDGWEGILEDCERRFQRHRRWS